MNRLSKSIWSGRYGVVGFDQNGAAVIGKKVLTPTDRAEQAVGHFRERMKKTVEAARRELASTPAEPAEQ